jgi:hypothetical protein
MKAYSACAANMNVNRFRQSIEHLKTRIFEHAAEPLSRVRVAETKDSSSSVCSTTYIEMLIAIPTLGYLVLYR